MVEIKNLTREKIDSVILKRIAKIVLKGENSKIKDISVAIVTAGEIRKLNKKYRKKDKPTDVLSFEASELDFSLGEIVLCPAEIKQNAKELNSSFKEELAKVFIHGILHLLGYEHEKNFKKAKLMEKKQEYYLSKL